MENIIIFFCLSIFIIAIIILIIYNINRKINSDGYKLVIDVHNFKSLQKHFLLDNPNGNGSDPTGGLVDYSYPMEKDKDGKIIKNVNGDITWQEISNSSNTKELIHDYQNGIEINLSKNLVKPSIAGAPRLSSRKLFKGGLFIFNVEAAPYGCGLWPALWLNGFVGGTDQYHEKEGTKLYKEGMEKLIRTTSIELRTACSKENRLDPKQKPDPRLSKYAGKPIYPASWPAGGEFDILEQVNFSNWNTVSVHSGAKCEVKTNIKEYPETSYSSPTFMHGWINDDYKTQKLRPTCGYTYESGFGKYAGCKGPDYGGDTRETFDGKPLPREICPYAAAGYGAGGNSQINAPYGSFGQLFNQSGGGVYALQWIPNKKAYIWYWPTSLFDDKYLKKNNGPLSDNPMPSKWGDTAYASNSANVTRGPYKILIAPYDIGEPGTMSKGCDFNFQSIIINITIGGGWAGGVLPKYCSVDNIPGSSESYPNYVNKCYKANPQRAYENEWEFDSVTGCYDGAPERGPDAKPVFFTQDKFKIRNIRVFQTDNDQSVW